MRVPLIYIGLSLLIASSIMACGPTTPATVTQPKTQTPADTENQAPPEVTNPEPSPEDTATGTEWSTVQSFTGKESKDTPPFNISGTKWRIVWTVDTKYPEYAIFDILVYPQDTSGLLTKRISYSKETSGGTVYIDEGGHDYYLKVIAANIGNWTIIVEDYASQKLTCPVQITYIQYKGTDYAGSMAASQTIIEFDEYVEIKNTINLEQNITGWMLKNLTKGGPSFTFPTFRPCSCEWYGNWTDCAENCYPQRPCIIEPYKSIRIYTGEPHHESGGYCFYYVPGDIWDNETPDTAVLYNLAGQEVSRKSYVIPTRENATSGE